MPITKSAIKAAKRSVKLQERNNLFKNRMKVSIKEISKIYKYVDKCAKV